MGEARGVKLEFTPPDGHEKVAERNVRTIKEHVYASILSLGHAIDDVMLEGIVRDTVTMLNYLPTAEVDRSAPRTRLDGERLNFQRWSRSSAGQVGEFEIPYPERAPGTRKELGYILCHQGDNAIVRLLPSGKRTVVRSAHFTALEKTPGIIKLIEEGISAGQKQRYNDLLADIAEHYAHIPSPTPDVQVSPIAPPKVDESGPHVRQDFAESINFLASPPAPKLPAPEPPHEEPPVPETSNITATHVLLMGDAPHDLAVAPRVIQEEEPVPNTPQLPADAIAPTLRRSQRACAHKPAGFYAQSTGAESVQDYIACHMSAAECSKLYGKEAQEAAGAEEVMNIIGREALIPRDYRSLSQEELSRVLSSFIFYKAKDLLPSEAIESESQKQPWTTVQSKRDKKLQKKKKYKIKGRWVGGGHRQKRDEALRDRVAPTARSTTHSIVFATAAKEKRPLHVDDIPSAYLQAKHIPADGRTTFIRADKETTAIIVRVYPDLVNYVTPNGTMILEVAKALYDLVESAWLWYQELSATLETMGYHVSEADRGLFVKKTLNGRSVVASNIVSVHVDDLISAASPNAEGERLSKEFWDPQGGQDGNLPYARQPAVVQARRRTSQRVETRTLPICSTEGRLCQGRETRHRLCCGLPTATANLSH